MDTVRGGGVWGFPSGFAEGIPRPGQSAHAVGGISEKLIKLLQPHVPLRPRQHRDCVWRAIVVPVVGEPIMPMLFSCPLCVCVCVVGES